MKSSGLLAYAGRILALVGGILLIIFSLLSLVGIVFTLPFRSPLVGLNILGHELIPLVLGIIAVIASKYAGKLEWAIVLIIVGYLGSDFGGLLVLLGGVLGLISAIMKRA